VRPPTRRSTSALAAGLVAALLALPAPARAQCQALLALDDPAYAIIDALRARGSLRGLSPVDRPYRLVAIDSALAEDEERAGGGGGDRDATSSLRRALRARLVSSGDGDEAQGAPVAAYLAAASGGVAQTTGRRELMLARDDDRARDVPFAHVQLALPAGPVIAVARVRVDGQLREDPEFLGKKDRAASGRMEDAYLLASFRYGELFAGRTVRNIGPAPLQGLQVGSAPYSYEHLLGRIGTRHVRLTALVASLDDKSFWPGRSDDERATDHLPAPRPYSWQETPDSMARRWFAFHRLAISGAGLELGLSESVVWGGVGRGFEPTLANPLGFWTLSQYSEKSVSNPSLGVDLSWQTAGAGTYAAQLMLDDVQIDACETSCEEPTSYGVVATAEGVPLPLAARGFASYARVSNLAYRTPAAWERYASGDVGLGHAQSD
jgi:hypothetical protein